MNCRQIESNLSAYLDGELCGSEMLQLRSHLHTCATCSQELEALRTTRRLIGALPEPEPDDEFCARLMAKVLEHKSANRSRVPWGHVALVSSLAAACAIALVMRSGRNQQLPAQPNSESLAFDVQRDQAYMSGSDPLGTRSPIITASYGSK